MDFDLIFNRLYSNFLVLFLFICLYVFIYLLSIYKQSLIVLEQQSDTLYGNELLNTVCRVQTAIQIDQTYFLLSSLINSP